MHTHTSWFHTCARILRDFIHAHAYFVISYMRTYAATSIHTHVSAYIQMYQHTYKCISIHTHVSAYIHTYKHTYTCINIHETMVCKADLDNVSMRQCVSWEYKCLLSMRQCASLESQHSPLNNFIIHKCLAPFWYFSRLFPWWNWPTDLFLPAFCREIPKTGPWVACLFHSTRVWIHDAQTCPEWRTKYHKVASKSTLSKAQKRGGTKNVMLF